MNILLPTLVGAQHAAPQLGNQRMCLAPPGMASAVPGRIHVLSRKGTANFLAMAACLAIVACLSLPTRSRAECVEVALPPGLSRLSPYQWSFQEVRIAALLDGRAAAKAEIHILSARNQPRLLLTTDPHGLVTPPPLTPGRYHLVAVEKDKDPIEPYLAELFLDVSKDPIGASDPRWLHLDLVPATQFRPLELPSLADLVAGGKQMPALGTMPKLEGFVVDPSGAAIPGASIAVVPTDTPDDTRWIETTTDERGHFALPLKPGAYKLRVAMPGFQAQTMDFEISTQAGAKGAKVLLNVAVDVCT
jgi:hypothetical protein